MVWRSIHTVRPRSLRTAQRAKRTRPEASHREPPLRVEITRDEIAMLLGLAPLLPATAAKTNNAER